MSEQKLRDSDEQRVARLRAFEEIHDKWEFKFDTETEFDQFLHDEIIRLRELEAALAASEPQDDELSKQIQTSGPQCKKCGAFTTHARVDSHGLCMKCEQEAK